MDESHIESNTKRKLASIQIVDRVETHKNADTLEIATVLGWQIVTRIGEAKTGDLVVYCEIDSVLPKAEWLPDAVKSRMGESDSFRLKTVKLRGELSQGLIIPLSASMPLIMATDPSSATDPFDITSITTKDIGRNVTEELGITKYDPWSYKVPGAKTFPVDIISKTDEERIQSSPKLLAHIVGKPYYATVKCDGMSCTFIMGPDTEDETKKVLIVCSRNQIRKRPETEEELLKDPYWFVAVKYNIEEKLSRMPSIGIQCEICGPNIQCNLLGLKDLEIFVFNVVDLAVNGGKLVPYKQLLEVTKALDLPMVPIEDVGDEFKPTSIKELLLKAEGHYPKSKKQREGLVYRTQDSTVSFKVISNKYLLKNQG